MLIVETEVIGLTLLLLDEVNKDWAGWGLDNWSTERLIGILEFYNVSFIRTNSDIPLDITEKYVCYYIKYTIHACTIIILLLTIVIKESFNRVKW